MKDNKITATRVRRMKNNELRQTAISMGLIVKENGFFKKKSYLLKEVLSILSKQRMKEDRIQIDETHYKIIDSHDLNKSQKMRRLFDLGMPTKHIAIAMDAHYSFVHGVIQRYREEQFEIELQNIETNSIPTIAKDDALSAMQIELGDELIVLD